MLESGGTTWLGKARQVKEDAEAVKRLRSCGAVLAGKTNMHELGMGTTGINPHYGYVNKMLEQEQLQLQLYISSLPKAVMNDPIRIRDAEYWTPSEILHNGCTISP